MDNEGNKIIQSLFTEGWRDDPVLIRNALLQGLGDDDRVLMKAAATSTTQGKQRETDW